MNSNIVLRGVVPAHLTPFDNNYEIDENELRNHIKDIVQIDGVGGIISNGHAGEVTSLSKSEYSKVLKIVKNEINGKIPLISGVIGENQKDAVEMAINAKNSGADAILLFPPNSFELEAALDFERPFKYVYDIADSVDIPIVLFQFSLSSKKSYTTDTLVKMVEEIPSIIAIKEGTDNIPRYEENLYALRNCSRKVSVLCTNNTMLLASLAIGGDGIISGSGSVISNILADLWKAVEAGNLRLAREINEKMYPLIRAFYTSPLIDMHNRMKCALNIMGKQKYCISRPPLLPVKEEERKVIEEALIKGGLL